MSSFYGIPTTYFLFSPCFITVNLIYFSAALFEEGYTCGDDLQDALTMAEDALASYLTWQEDHHRSIPEASNPKAIELSMPDNCISTLIEADTDHYRRLLSNRAVKKTLSIPEWMDEKGKAKGLNFSKVLQDALEKEFAMA